MDPDRKPALRRTALDARRRLDPAERAAASARITTRLRDLPLLRRVGVVAVYAATADEVDLDAYARWLRGVGVRTLLPRVRGERLELVTVTDDAPLRAGHRGVREPGGIVIDPSVVEAVIVPGVAFDPHGGRLGHGGGHYDRLLAGLPSTARRVGVAFACQVVPAVPIEAHDEVVDAVVTERAVHHRRGVDPA